MAAAEIRPSAVNPILLLVIRVIYVETSSHPKQGGADPARLILVQVEEPQLLRCTR